MLRIMDADHPGPYPFGLSRGRMDPMTIDAPFPSSPKVVASVASPMPSIKRSEASDGPDLVGLLFPFLLWGVIATPFYLPWLALKTVPWIAIGSLPLQGLAVEITPDVRVYDLLAMVAFIVSGGYALHIVRDRLEWVAAHIAPIAVTAVAGAVSVLFPTMTPKTFAVLLGVLGVANEFKTYRERQEKKRAERA